LTNQNRSELSKDSYELQALMLQHEKMEESYREIFPKVCCNLIHDLIMRLQKDPQNPPLYTVEVFTKEGTDSQASKNHILATTGTLPAIYDHGTHYVTHMRLTLEILKRLNDFEFVLEIMGDYTGTDASLGAAHNMGDAHISRGAPERVYLF
jgi:putative aminopeptidase FrvX